MAKRPLYLVTETRGHYAVSGKVKPYHWSFFIQVGQDQTIGTAHQLHGMPGAFYYNGAEEVDLKTYETRKEQLEIGEIDKSSPRLESGCSRPSPHPDRAGVPR